MIHLKLAADWSKNQDHLSVYKQALDMAGALHGANVDLLNDNRQVTTSSSIASALFLLTIKNHIEKEYLS